MSTRAVDVVRAETDGDDLLLVSGTDGARPAWTVLAATLALADALRAAAGVPAEVEWPDAVTLPRAMCGGAGTAQQVATAGLDGDLLTVRLRLTGSALGLPPGRTSVWAEGGTADAEAVAAAYSTALAARLGQLGADDPVLASDYRARCVTTGRRVVVDGRDTYVTGVAADGTLTTTP